MFYIRNNVEIDAASTFACCHVAKCMNHVDMSVRVISTQLVVKHLIKGMS